MYYKTNFLKKIFFCDANNNPLKSKGLKIAIFDFHTLITQWKQKLTGTIGIFCRQMAHNLHK